MQDTLRRFCPQLLLLSTLIGLGYWAQDLKLAPATSTTDTAKKDSSQPEKSQAARKIGEGKLSDPQTLAVTEEGVLLALNHGPKAAVHRFTIDGQEFPSLPLPATLTAGSMPNLLASGPGETVYLARARARGIWKLNGSQAEKINAELTPAAIAFRNNVLFVLGHEQQGITRIEGQKVSNITLSAFPNRGYFSRLRVRSNGDFYVYANEEHLVWRFDKNGKLIEKIGGGGEAPPKTNLTADHIGHHFDVDEQGNVYWTLGDYGTLFKIDAATGIASRFWQRQGKQTNWIGNFASLRNLVVQNGFAFVLDRSFNRITALPLAWVTPDAPNVATLDTRAFGLDFQLKSKAPYKVFTAPQIHLQTEFAAGNRKLRSAKLILKVRDFNGKTVANQTSTPAFKDGSAITIDLPVFALPQLGWYQIEASLFAGDNTELKKPLLSRVHYITRSVTDASVPIPQQEHTGWDDLHTPRLVGTRLHRYSLHYPSQIDEFEADIRNARKIGMPYFTLLINKKDCTPENARAVVEKLKSFGDEEPLIELLNEPNLNMSAREYVELLHPCRDAIKKANPRARIMGPVQCGTDLRWLEAFFAAGGGELIDVVSLHTYERHNSMDASHWKWKFRQIQDLLKKYNCDKKPLYQTEHGFLGDYTGLFVRPQWQANQILLEKLVLDQFGIDDSKYFYYYVNQSSYRDYSAYIVNNDRELLPAAAMLRIRRYLLGEAKFVRALDFDAHGAQLITANLYRDAERDVVILQNNGALDAIEVKAGLPQGTRVFDCWGNQLPLTESLKVGRTPLYLHLPREAAFELNVPAQGRNIAAQAAITVDDAKGRQSIARLTNGRLEFDFLNQPEKVGFLAFDEKLPLELTLEWSAPQTIQSAVLYASMADNDKSTPLAYELWARRSGKWQKVGSVDQTPQVQSFNTGNTWHLTGYENPWIFRHLFNQPDALVADALRYVFKRTTFGHYPTREMRDNIGGRIGQNFANRVELREIEIYGF